MGNPYIMDLSELGQIQGKLPSEIRATAGQTKMDVAY
jgi:hypothetical protein